ncbi:MAG TPA: hypothetical protein VME20_05970 [Acidimicrobiales bacterium]|nr:hypothetical protein [Acidimicrobiales bacterium]
MAQRLLTPEDVGYLEVARALVRSREARGVRERYGFNRPEFVASCDHQFSVFALKSWEEARRFPRAPQGVAYGRALSGMVKFLAAVGGES